VYILMVFQSCFICCTAKQRMSESVNILVGGSVTLLCRVEEIVEDENRK
jgi:hypothetical protein